MKHLFTIIFSLQLLTAYNQSVSKIDSLPTIDLNAICNENFSQIKKDSTFSNFYISNYKDTMFFRPASCIISIELTSPLTFRRRIKGGWAEGKLRVFQQNDSSYTWLNGEFTKGLIISGNTYEYYKSNSPKLTGQIIEGQRFGIWTWYFENGKIQRLITFESAESVKEIEFDQNGKVLYRYDLFDEKN